MKKKLTLIICTFILFLNLLSAIEKEKQAVLERNKSLISLHSNRLFTPDYTFQTQPILLYNTTNDGFSTIQNGNSQSLNPITGNSYLFYSTKDANGGTKQRITAITSDGELLYSQPVYNDNSWEYQGGSASDPLTGNPFFVWTGDYPAVNSRSLWLSFESNQMISTRSLIISPESQHFFLNPSIYISSSPLSVNHKRLYVMYADQYINQTSYRLSYCDYTASIFNNSTFQETWTTINLPYFSEITQNSIYKCYPTLSVDGETIVVSGYTDAKEPIIDVENGEIIYPVHHVFILQNNNYGQGGWSIYTFNPERQINKPTNQGGVYDPSLVYATDFCIKPGENRRFNSSLLDNTLHLPGVFSVGFTRFGTDVWYMTLSQTIKDLQYNIDTHTLKVVDLYPKGDFPLDDQLMIPWDSDENGIPDQFYYNSANPNDSLNGQWLYNKNMYPHMHYNTNNTFNYQNLQIATDTQKGWIACLWQDSYKAYMNNQNGSFPDYESVPEVYISISNDKGINWTDPIILNSQNTLEFDNSIPSYFSLGPNIEVLDSQFGVLKLLYTDDNSYGNYLLNDGLNTGGKIKYASLKINFYPEVQDSVNHYETIWSGNPINPYHLNIQNCLIDIDSLEAGDEIGVFDGNLCVGIYKMESLVRDMIPILCSKNTLTTGTPNGYTAGHAVRIKLWRHRLQREYNQLENMEIEWINGTNSFVNQGSATVNLIANSAGFQVEKPTISVPSGYYEEMINVQLSCSTPGANIHYTTDGLIPTALSPIYSNPISVNQNTTLKVRAMLDYWAPSEADSTHYTFPEGNQDQSDLLTTILHRAYPNPFNPVTTIPYSIKRASEIQIEIYNIKGQRVKTLVKGFYKEGNYSVNWNGRDQNNKQVSSGVYFYRMVSKGYEKTCKLLYLK